MVVVTALLAAAVPTAIYSLLLWWLDRYEKEPLGLLLAAFFWGAIPAIALALLAEPLLMASLEGAVLGPGMSNWTIVPIVEEGLKALALVGLFLWARHEFDGPLDGIVYGALIGFGFSMTENALYFLRYGDLSALFWLRGVLFGLNHAFFTSLAGLALGAVRYERPRILRLIALIGGLGLAILFHAIHNFFVGGMQTTGIILSWLVQSGGVIVVLLVAGLAWRHERQWMLRELGEEVQNGIITADDFSNVTSSPRRIRQQMLAFVDGGWSRFRATRRLYHLITELAFCKSKVRLLDRFHTHHQIDHLRAEIVALRIIIEHDQRALPDTR